MAQGLEHVRVAQVPALRAAIVHDPVVALGRRDQPRVLRRVQEVVAVLRRIIELLLEQGLALLDDGPLALGIAPAERRAAIGHGVPLPGREASVPLARRGTGFGIDPVQIVEHRANRPGHVVDVEPVEAGTVVHRPVGIVRVHPADQRLDVGVAPHPGGEALERRFRAGPRLAMADEAVDGGGIRPIRLDRDDGEAVVLDEVPSDGGTRLVEFAGAVARLPQQQHPAIREPIEQAAECRIVERGQRLCRFGDHLRQRLLARGAGGVIARRAAAILRPAMGADQRHERDGAEVLLLEAILGDAGHLAELLIARFSRRHDQVPAHRQLLLQRMGYIRPARGHQDRVERSFGRQSAAAVATLDPDAVVAERLDPRRRCGAELRMPFDGEHLIGDLAENGGGVAGSGPHLQHPILPPDLGRLDHGRLDHGRHDERLGDRLFRPDRQGRVLIREFGKRLRYETFARHRAHRVEHRRVANATPRDLHVHHPGAGGSEVGHGSALAVVLGLSLALGVRQLLQLLLAHGVLHALGGTFQLRLRGVAALGAERGTGGLLLGGGLCGHLHSPLERGQRTGATMVPQPRATVPRCSVPASGGSDRR